MKQLKSLEFIAVVATSELSLRPQEGFRVAESTDRNSTHLAGEFFVAAELYRRGYSVAMTLGNAKAIDLFAERGSRTVNVQVKAIRDKKSIGWPIMKDSVRANIIYVFVCLNPPDIAPDYYICTSDEARSKVKQYATRGIIDLSTLKGDEAYRNRWDKIEGALTPVEMAQRKRLINALHLTEYSVFPLKDGSVIEAGPSFLEGLLGINAGNVDELRRLAPQAPDDIGLDGLAMPYEEEFDL